MAQCSCSSRFIITVQLVAWSLGGIVLLYRGLATLAQDTTPCPAPSNSTNGNGTSTSTVEGADVNVTDAAQTATTNTSTSTNATVTQKYPELKRPRPTALILVALGLVVLAIGPALVAVKHCEAINRSSFQKVASEEKVYDDPPPSYESAVAAPRYSSLFGEDMEVLNPATPCAKVVKCSEPSTGSPV